MVEAGVKGATASDCSGILVSSKTPAPVVARLSKALVDVVL